MYFTSNKKGLVWSLFFSLLYSACAPSKKKENVQDTAPLWDIIGPGGGGATFIPTFSPDNPDNFLVRCDMTGSYLTQDGGQSFRELNFPGGASGYAYDPADSNNVYAGSAVLSRSQDRGKTWQQIFPAKKEVIREFYTGDHAEYNIETTGTSLYEHGKGGIKNIRIDPVRPASIYFSMGPFFFYSTDNGATWHKKDCTSPVDFIYTNATALKDKVFIFTTTALSIFNKSTGAFSQQPYPETMVPAFSFTGGVIKGTDSLVFYTIHHNTHKPVDQEFGYSELWVSDNLAGNWRQITDTVVSNAATGINPSFSMVACAEKDAASAYLVTNRYQQKEGGKLSYWYGALKTANAGRAWQWCWKGGGGTGQYGLKDGQDAANLSDAWVKQAFGGEYIRLIDVGVFPADGKVAIVTDWYRTMKTVDGGSTWQQIYSKPQPGGGYTTNGMNVTTTYGVHFDPFDSNHIAISYTDIGYHHSYDGGKSWIRSANVPVEWSNTCYWVVFDPAEKNKVWSAWSGMHDFPRGKMARDPAWKQKARGGVCISEDGGKTWKPSVQGMGFDAPTTCIVLDTTSPVGKRTLYAAVYNKGVFKSVDGGNTWVLKNKGITDNTCAFELTLTARGTLFLTVSATAAHKNGKTGRDIYSGAVYRSTDGAESWTKLHVTDGLLFPNGMDYDRTDPRRIYLGCWSNIALSDLIGGETARATGGNEELKMPGGVFVSEDEGNTWTSVFDPQQYVYDVAADPRVAGRLFINTFNGAAYQSDNSGKSWKKLKGYDFHWGQRPVIDIHSDRKIYLSTFGSSVWHGIPETE